MQKLAPTMRAKKPGRSIGSKRLRPVPRSVVAATRTRVAPPYMPNKSTSEVSVSYAFKDNARINKSKEGAKGKRGDPDENECVDGDVVCKDGPLC